MNNTPNEFTYSGEPPTPRNVGEVVNKWNKTYKPQPNIWIPEHEQKLIDEFNDKEELEFWVSVYKNTKAQPKKQSFFNRLRTSFWDSVAIKF